MNLYIVVEGKTEKKVYPFWLNILQPTYTRVDDPWNLSGKGSCYYLLCGGGFPNIYDHISNSVLDINDINSKTSNKYDYLMVCIDTEECAKGEEEQIIRQNLIDKGISLNSAELIVFEHQVCMESWFLGNRKVFKKNPQEKKLVDYINFYDVSVNNPEYMESINISEFSTKAQFHYDYLHKMLLERNLNYTKNNPITVQQLDYLNELINRCTTTKDLLTFKAWYDFVKKLK